VARNVREQDAYTRPAIANALPRLDPYDTVLLASPIWNVRAPMIMTTFTEALDFAGKTVHPVTTHAMSGLERPSATTPSRAPAPRSPKASPYKARKSRPRSQPSAPGSSAPGSSLVDHRVGAP
jgi:hypothetical protein